MKQIRMKIFALLTVLSLICGQLFLVSAEVGGTITRSGTEENRPTASDVGVEEGALSLNCKSAVLMEAKTGSILYVQNPDEALPPASVTKIMTLLLVMEAVDAGTVRLDDTVTVSANAASMGGSQVYLKEGEQMTLEDLLKSVVIASANDAAVALAEHIAGSVSSFVKQMNTRAAELGMKETFFENVTGLDDTAEAHLTSAHDIAIMSRALIRHKTILQYSSIWMDSIRDGAFGLTNTNRLVRFYPGCTGLKTGSTSKAGFCVSVTAEREGMSLICVIMGAESRDERNAAATQLLDWGFANYGVFTAEAGQPAPIGVLGGVQDHCAVSYADFSCVLPKAEIGKVECRVEIPASVTAPIAEGAAVGCVKYVLKDRQIGSVPILADETVLRIGFFEILARMAAGFLLI